MPIDAGGIRSPDGGPLTTRLGGSPQLPGNAELSSMRLA
jgi:hypothetical protein